MTDQEIDRLVDEKSDLIEEVESLHKMLEEIEERQVIKFVLRFLIR